MCMSTRTSLDSLPSLLLFTIYINRMMTDTVKMEGAPLAMPKAVIMEKEREDVEELERPGLKKQIKENPRKKMTDRELEEKRAMMKQNKRVQQISDAMATNRVPAAKGKDIRYHLTHLTQTQKTLYAVSCILAIGGVVVALWFTAVSPKNASASKSTSSSLSGFTDFTIPASVVVDSQSNIYFADSTNQGIRIITSEGEKGVLVSSTDPTTSLAKRSSYHINKNASVYNATGLAIDSNDNIYFTDIHDHSVKMFNMTSRIISIVAGTGDIGNLNSNNSLQASFYNPLAIAVDPANDGILYLSDYGNNVVRRIKREGESSYSVTKFAGMGNSSIQAVDDLADTSEGADNGNKTATGSAASFARPVGIAVDVNSTVLVADYESFSIRKIGRDGRVATFKNFGFVRPTTLVVDAEGTVYVSGNNTVYQVFSNGTQIDLFSFGPRNDQQPSEYYRNQPAPEPLGIFIDRKNGAPTAIRGGNLRAVPAPMSDIIPMVVKDHQ